jgi:hypothetical protein
MEPDLLQQLLEKSITKDELLQKARHNGDVLPIILRGVSSPKAAIRYGCARVLLALSEESPEQLYPYMDTFIDLLESKYRILTWNALAIIANLATVDTDNKFDAIFHRYFRFIHDESMATVANVVGHAGKIALAKPHLSNRITAELLKVDHLATTPHLTEECKRVIAQAAIKSFNMFFDQIEHKANVIAFVKRHRTSPRKTLRTDAEKFLKRVT